MKSEFDISAMMRKMAVKAENRSRENRGLASYCQDWNSDRNTIDTLVIFDRRVIMGDFVDFVDRITERCFAVAKKMDNVQKRIEKIEKVLWDVSRPEIQAVYKALSDAPGGGFCTVRMRGNARREFKGFYISATLFPDINLNRSLNRGDVRYELL